MSGFFAIFSGVSAALLLTSLATGLTKVAFLGLNHLMWGLIAVLLAVSVHCLIFGIFTGAGKDARELFEDLNAKSELVLKIKAFRREVIQSFELVEDRFGIEPELAAKVGRANLRVFEVPINYFGRTYEEGKKIGWKDGFRALYAIGKYGLLKR